MLHIAAAEEHEHIRLRGVCTRVQGERTMTDERPRQRGREAQRQLRI